MLKVKNEINFLMNCEKEKVKTFSDCEENIFIQRNKRFRIIKETFFLLAAVGGATWGNLL